MIAGNRPSIRGYRLDLARMYDPERHTWVQVLDGGRARVGMDSLGVETTGDLVELVLQEPGLQLARGQSFGSIEAAKFVGPLSMPISGTILAHNDAAVADPRLVSADPFDAGWLVEVAPADDTEFEMLLSDPEAILTWFEDEVDRYEAEGVLAE